MKKMQENEKNTHLWPKRVKVTHLGLFSSPLSGLPHISILVVHGCGAAVTIVSIPLTNCVVVVVLGERTDVAVREASEFFLACGAHMTEWSVRSTRVYKPVLLCQLMLHFKYAYM